ncbi:chromosome segregation protein SMC [bacterium]|nr:chromosome segregation protein SMC [bacterium]
MHLSGLEIHGFKSFPHKTKLTFTPGVMAIVGPNGCGKTNIVDAVRWVLGEQRSTVLRSDKMEHVIFAGSLRQKQSGRAEVTLVLENDRGVLPEEYTEIAITRRLDREGDSGYLINRRPSRLKDIRNLFADTGLGPDSYSIIELKMVETILSARTDERRRLFEEAAGVTGYKAKLKTTRYRLNETRSDLVRLADLLNEVTTRRNSLKRQVNKARRYRFLREALRVIELKASSAEILELQAKIAPLEQSIAQDKKRRDELTSVLDKEARSLREIHGKLSAQEETLQSLGADKAQAEDRLTNARSEIEVLNERIRSVRARSEQRETEEETLSQRLVDVGEALRDLAEKDERAGDRAREIEQRLEGMRDTWEDLQGRQRNYNQRRDNAERERVKAEREQARVDGDLKRADQRLIAINNLLSTAEQAKTPDAPDSPETATAELESLQGRLTSAETAVSDARAIEETKRNELGESEKNAVGLARDLNSARERVKFLEGIVRGGVGRSEAVQALLTAGLDEVHGRLGDAVVVKKKQHQAAVAAAIESFADAIVVAAGSVNQAVEFLQNRDKGRAALALAPKTAPAPVNLPGDSRVTPLADHVEIRGEAGDAARAHLQRYGLVPDLATLLDLAAETRGNFGLVTPEGCALHPDGRISAGQASVDDLGASGLLDDATQLTQDLERAHDAMQAELAIARKDAEAAHDARIKAETARTRLREAVKAQESILRKAETEWRDYQSRVQRAQEETARLQQEKTDLETLQTELRKELANAAAVLKDANALYTEIRAQGEDLRQEGEALRTARDQLREKQVEASSALARVRGELSRQLALQEEYEHQLERLRQERDTAGGALEDALDRLRRLQGEMELLEKEVEQQRAELSKQRKSYEALQQQRSEIDGFLSQRREEQTRLSDRVHNRELERKDMLHRLSSVRERILEAYDIDLMTKKQEELPLAVDDDNPYLDLPLGELREQVRDFGPVNQMALEEYEVVDRRWQQLTEQNDDLERAVNALEDTIREINSIARKRFLETFSRVEGHFVGLFSRLFGGGEAALSLAEGDPLEAGIHIFASPKGKKLSSIDLLSGGEKAMTAIALLFALYLERPSPFCFLDEVDAPLDDVNVIRFNRLLREFTDRTQFLVVTHNKLTMERADRLYGVTMEEEGVSKLVAVEIGRTEPEEVDS